MEKRQSGRSLRWVAVALALAGAACGGEKLGGNNQGAGGEPCQLDVAGSSSCLPGGSFGGTPGKGGATGEGGSGGSVADAGTALCDQIVAKYQTAVSVASACTPGAANQCQFIVGNVPTNCPVSSCGAGTYVNDSSLVESERGNWLNAGCGGPPQLCIDVGCNTPPGVCVLVPGSITGTCVPPPADGGAPATGPDAGETCDQLAADYQTALSVALICTPGAPNQCQGVADPMLTPCDDSCGSRVSVNDVAGVNEARMRWIAQCAGDYGCPLTVCEQPATTGTCVPAANDSSGACVTGTPVATN